MNSKTDTPMDVVPPMTAMDDTADEAEYRTVSGLAVVSLLFGLASPLCSLAPLLWAIPLFGVPLAIVAMRRVADSGGTMIGRRAAIVGLALCVGSMCATSSRAIVIRHFRTQQASDFGLEWLELLRAGNTEQAFLQTTAQERYAATPVAERRSEEDPVVQFAEDPVVQVLQQWGAGADIRVDRNLKYLAGAGHQYVVEQQYLVTPSDTEGSDAPIAVRLTLLGIRAAAQASVQWSVSSYVSGDLPDADARDH